MHCWIFRNDKKESHHLRVSGRPPLFQWPQEVEQDVDAQEEQSDFPPAKTDINFSLL